MLLKQIPSFQQSWKCTKGFPKRKIVFQSPPVNFHDCWREGNQYYLLTISRLIQVGCGAWCLPPPGPWPLGPPPWPLPPAASGTQGGGATQLPDEVLGVAQPVIQGPRRLLDPVDHIAAPIDLHLHHRRLAQARHQLGVDRVEGLQRGQREDDPFVANCPEPQRLLTVMDGGHRHLHHGQRAVHDEILCRQECPHLLEDVTPLLLAARLGDAQALQEGRRLLPHLDNVAHPLVRGRALRIAAPVLCLHNQREGGPGRVDILKCEPVGVHSRQARQVPRSRLSGPKHPITLRPEDTNHLLRCRALAPVHLSSDLQGRVDDWVDVVLLAREWVSPALKGQELLRRELKLLVSAPDDLTACVLLPNPPKHPELSLIRFIAQRIRDSLPSSVGQGWSPQAGGTLGGGRRLQLAHLLQQCLLVPRVLRRSEHLNVRDILLLDVPPGRMLSGSSSSRGFACLPPEPS